MNLVNFEFVDAFLYIAHRINYIIYLDKMHIKTCNLELLNCSNYNFSKIFGCF